MMYLVNKFITLYSKEVAGCFYHILLQKSGYIFFINTRNNISVIKMIQDKKVYPSFGIIPVCN